jgi:hypothetical protein
VDITLSVAQAFRTTLPPYLAKSEKRGAFTTG